MTTYQLTRRGIAVVTLATVAWLVAVGALLTTEATHDAGRTYPPCVTEDAPGPCYWDAPNRGNGQGTSYVVTPDQTLIYR